MKVINGICYADDMRMNLLIKEISLIKRGTYLVTFSTNEKRIFDATCLHGPVFEPLADDDILNSAKVEHGVITWNNGEIDVAPEKVYKESQIYDSIAI